MPDGPFESGSLIDSSRVAHRRRLVDRADPRVRLVTAVSMAVLVALASRLPVLAAAFGAALLLALGAGLRVSQIWRRLAVLNGFVLVVLLLVPLTTPGETLVRLGSLEWTCQGFVFAAAIGLKANAIVLGLLVLVGSLEISTLGHALSHLRVPDKLTQLLLFTVRYIDLLHRESQRLRTAMKLRGFRPRMNVHTYRAYGYLIGMLLVRSLDRSERIIAAMKCRGFRGRFYLLDHFELSAYDFWFSLAAAACLVLLALAEWL